MALHLSMFRDRHWVLLLTSKIGRGVRSPPFYVGSFGSRLGVSSLILRFATNCPERDFSRRRRVPEIQPQAPLPVSRSAFSRHSTRVLVSKGLLRKHTGSGASVLVLSLSPGKAEMKMTGNLAAFGDQNSAATQIRSFPAFARRQSGRTSPQRVGSPGIPRRSRSFVHHNRGTASDRQSPLAAAHRRRRRKSRVAWAIQRSSVQGLAARDRGTLRRRQQKK